MVTGRRADRLSAAVRATLDGLVRFDESGLDDDAFFSLLAERIADAVRAEKVGVGTLEGGALRMRGSVGFPADVAASVNLPVDEHSRSLADRIVFDDVVFHGDLEDPELAPYREPIEHIGARNAMAIGWRAGRSILGALAAFDSRRPDGFSADDLLVFQLAGDLSAFVYRQRVARKWDEVRLRLTTELSRLTTFEAMATATARAARELLPGIECGIVEVPRGRPDSLRTLTSPPGVAGIVPEETDAAGTGASAVLATGKPLETDELERFSKHGKALHDAGFRRVRCLAVSAGRPLPDGRAALGTIAFLSRSRQPFAEEERALMDDLARRLGLLAHRAELLEQEAEASARLRIAFDAAIDIGSSLDPPQVIARLLERAVDALSADRATLSSIDGDDLVIEGSYAPDGTAFEVGRRFQYANSPQFMTVLHTRQPLHETYRVEDAEDAARPALSVVRQAITVPITDQDSVVATVTVSRRSDRPFTAADGRLLELVAAGAGIALQNARLFQETARGQAALRVALDAAEDVAAAVDVAAVIDKLLERARDAAHASAAVLASVDRDAIIVDQATHRQGEGLRWPLPAGVMEALQGGRPAQIADPRSLAVTPEHHAAFAGSEWALSVPLILEGELVGVIGLGRPREPFSDEEVDAVRRLAPIAALLMRNARLLEDARQASRAKSDFLNMAGHELRTPLTVIRGYLSLVATGAYGEAPPDWAPVLALLERKSDELATMVESILVAARIQSGRLTVGSGRVDMVGVVREAVDRAGAAAALAGGAVIGRYPTAELFVNGDRTQLGVIADNLLANAIKYSSPPAAVTATVEQRDDFVEIRVADRGRGIAEHDRERIFEEFVRLENAGGDYPPGTGLGLFIARELAERYGGSLVLESSELGQGSTFKLRLPIA